MNDEINQINNKKKKSSTGILFFFLELGLREKGMKFVSFFLCSCFNRIGLVGMMISLFNKRVS